MHVTIVDDSKDNLKLYESILKDEFKLELIQDPHDLIPFLEKTKTDLILLDIHMPCISGFDLLPKIHESFPNLPVILLTGDASEEAHVKGLGLGADDFISKPVSLKVLIARIKNKIKGRPKKHEHETRIKMKNFILHCDLQVAEVADKRTQLTPIEFKIIHLFVKNPNKIFTREFISKTVWPDVHVQHQNIDTHLSNLRKKLHPFSENLKTIKSRGYILRTHL